MTRHYDLAETPEQEFRKRERLAQSAERLKQKERHLKIQEEKVRLLEEKRRKEENEKRVKTLKRVFSLYYLKQGAKAAAALVAAAASVMAALRVLAQYNPDARELYFALSNKLNDLVSSVIKGTPGKAEKLKSLIDEIGSAIKLPFQLLLNKFKNRTQDSKDIRLFGNTKVSKRDGSHPVIVYDHKYKDIIAPLVAGITFKTTILPILTIALKAGVTAGVAGAISHGIIGPIIGRIKQYGFSLISGKAKGLFAESIIDKIKKDVKILIDVFRTKDPSVAKQLMGGLTKFEQLT